jgi:hypothetical protein
MALEALFVASFNQGHEWKREGPFLADVLPWLKLMRCCSGVLEANHCIVLKRAGERQSDWLRGFKEPEWVG